MSEGGCRNAERRTALRLIAESVALAALLLCSPAALGGVAAASSGGAHARPPAPRRAAHRLPHGTRRNRRAPTRRGTQPGKAAAEPGIFLLHGTAAGASFHVTLPPVGLSVEYPTMASYLGSGSCPPPSLVSELRKLGSPPISLGGDSQDLTVPAPLTGSPPSWESETLYTLPSSFWSQLHCLLGATGEPLTAGLNAKLGSLAWVQQMVAGAQSAATNGLSLSLGNEPDLYYLPNYSSLSAPQPDDEAEAATLYLRVAQYLDQGVASLPLIGPELANPAGWRRQLPRIMDALHLQAIGVHLYPLRACGGKLTEEALLSPSAGAAPSALQWVVNDADGNHIPALITEANSASCGGQAGVSDSAASAVWAVRFVLAALKTGFREVRFHFSNGAYDPFVMNGATLTERPVDSALVALNHWLPPGSSLRGMTGLSGVLATAVSGSPSGVQIILDNEQPWDCIVSIGNAQSVHVEELGPTHVGVQTSVLGGHAGVLKLVLPGNTIAAVAPSVAVPAKRR